MAKKRLSQEFREQLQGLGSSLAAHTRTLDQHFENQETFLALRQQELEDATREALPAAEASRALEEALAPLVTGDFSVLPVKELQALCSRAGLKGYSRYRKAELVSLLVANDVAAPSLPVSKLTRSQLEAIASAALASKAWE